MDNKLKALFSSEDFLKLYSEFDKFVACNSMDEAFKDGVLLGLSGGADSVMLLYLLLYHRKIKFDFKICCVHVNHKIRGDEADRDELFSERLCDSLKVEFLSFEYDIPSIAKSKGLGLEEAAREVRYSCFNEIISSRSDLGVVATAHNSEDNMETVLLNILRGSGTKGGCGIPSSRGNILRPMLCISKADILKLFNKLSVDYVTDSTNLSVDYSRNYIRNEIAPRLLKLNERPWDMFMRFSSNLKFDEEYIAMKADEFIASRSEIPVSELRGLHKSVLLRVLSKLLSVSLSESLFSDISTLLSKNDFAYSVKKDVIFTSERGICRVEREPKQKEYYCFKISYGINEIPKYFSDFIISDKKENNSSNIYSFSIQTPLSSAIIVGDLYLRPKKDADSVFYGGMTRKVKKLFSDRKIPKSLRDKIPLLCDEKGIVWIPGFGVRDDGGKEINTKVIFASLNIKDSREKDRFYSAGEFKT